jgi:hypothetical protein
MNIRSIAAVLSASLILTAPTFAIPQSFSSGGGFQLRAGKPFEQFAADKDVWGGGSLKGDWSHPNKAGVQTLKDDAVVFGLPAAEIKAERSSAGVQRFLVLFRGESQKSDKALFERVAKNVQAFTGHAGKPSAKAVQTFRHADGVQITVRNRSDREVEVEFRPGR